jgi:hypothetical protein
MNSLALDTSYWTSWTYLDSDQPPGKFLPLDQGMDPLHEDVCFCLDLFLLKQCFALDPMTWTTYLSRGLLTLVADDTGTHLRLQWVAWDTKKQNKYLRIHLQGAKVTCEQGDSMTTNLESYSFHITGSQLASLLSAT